MAESDRPPSTESERPSPTEGDEGDPVEVIHIHADGTLEPHRECMQRLVKATKLPAGDLFKSEEELIEEACRKREEKIAFRR